LPDYKEVIHERLYLREPRTERLRKTSAGRLKHLTATGWRETERWHADDYITVRLERSGVSPWIGQPIRLKAADMPARRDQGRRGGGFGQGGGGRGGPGGPGRGGPGAPGRGGPGAPGAPGAGGRGR
jgi:hypothetical protein